MNADTAKTILIVGPLRSKQERNAYADAQRDLENVGFLVTNPFNPRTFALAQPTFRDLAGELFFRIHQALIHKADKHELRVATLDGWGCCHLSRAAVGLLREEDCKIKPLERWLTPYPYEGA